MKKTKRTRRFAAFAAAAVMAACAAVPMSAGISVSAVEAGKVTITGEQGTPHTYTVYKIFNGTVEDNKLGNITFAKADGFNDFLTALKSDATLGSKFTDCVDEAAVAAVLGGFTSNGDDAKAFAKFVANHSALVFSVSTEATSSIELNDDGYYLIVENSSANNTNNNALTSYLLSQYDASEGLDITAKSAMPTVDKQVHDEEADAEEDNIDGWGESADHAINESFQFKLIATLTPDDDYADYETYKVVFHDTMSNGVTFESIESVIVGDATLITDDYTATATAGRAGGDWTLTIADLKKHVSDLSTGATVTVIYNAHLNENAQVFTANADETENQNTVYLEYSNNPNASGSGENDNETGKTPEDTVFLFTYEVDNTKYKNSVAEGNKLAGAGFTLYTDKECTNAVQLYLKDGKYYPYTDGLEDVTSLTEMTSAEDGTFNIIGLDAGIYYLKETATPSGYTPCENVTITISATHKENEAGTNATLSLDDSNNMNNDIVNKSGSTLPSTGGIGTTIFTISGGILVVGAGVLLITKKRAKNEQ